LNKAISNTDTRLNDFDSLVTLIRAAAELNQYIGTCFEEICLQYMIHENNNGELPFVFTRSGRWWGNNPKTKSQEEIDLVVSSSLNQASQIPAKNLPANRETSA